MPLNCDHERACCSLPTWYMSMESHGAIIFTAEQRITRKKTRPIIIMSTTNPTHIDRGRTQFSAARGRRPTGSSSITVVVIQFIYWRASQQLHIQVQSSIKILQLIIIIQFNSLFINVPTKESEANYQVGTREKRKRKANIYQHARQ
jgi:hypothetical protein